MKKLFLAILSGLLYALSFPDTSIWPFILIFALPLFIIVDKSTWKEALFFGLVAGLVAWAGIIYWVAYVMYFFGGLSFFSACAVLTMFILYLALYFSAFAWISWLEKDSALALFTLPGAWVLLELIRTYALSGFPWELAGYALFPIGPAIQVSEIGGVYIISGIIIMVNLSLYRALKGRYTAIAVSLIVFIGIMTWGYWRMEHLDYKAFPLRAAVVQASVPQEEKWLPSMVEPSLETYSRLTKIAVSRGAEVIVWPESACNFLLFRQWEPTMKVIDLSKECNNTLLMAGSPAFEEGKYFNRVWALRNGSICGFYDKTHLVPFGEYLPLAYLLKPIFGTLTKGIGDFSSGSKIHPVGDAGILICFESIFPGLSRTLCRENALYLVNASNDAWFRTWSAPQQLLRMSAFRSIETRRWLIRSVNHGISAIIDPTGRIRCQIGLNKEGVLVDDIEKIHYSTFYSRHGPIIDWLWVIVTIVVLTIKILNATYFRHNARV